MRADRVWHAVHRRLTTEASDDFHQRPTTSGTIYTCALIARIIVGRLLLLLLLFLFLLPLVTMPMLTLMNVRAVLGHDHCCLSLSCTSMTLECTHHSKRITELTKEVKVAHTRLPNVVFQS